MTNHATMASRRVDDGSVCLAVVEAVAEAKGVDPLDVEQPLYDVVDPDALESLFDPVDGPVAHGHVTFSLDDYEVTVTASGDVRVYPHG